MQKPTPILTLLLACSGPLAAQITADINVSQVGGPLGTITVELDHLKAPMATANFIGLATGKLSWIDSATGIVQHNTPYYDGIIFHRVIDGFMNQTGSQNGLGTDGPGYKFQDGAEIDNGLNHASAYVISMANSGVDTNGSQLFLTAVPTPWLDGKHIVFGEVSATGNSRLIVEQINNLPVIDADGPDNIPNTGDENHRPVNDVWIESISVNYNGVDFDIHAQGLPVVSSLELDSPITPSTTALDFTQPPGSTFHLSYSNDLSTWERVNPRNPRTLSCIDPPENSFPLPSSAKGNLQQYFQPALVNYDPSSLIAPDLTDRTLTVLLGTFSETIPITFNFKASGNTWAWPLTAESGTAQFFDPYSATLYSAFTTLQLSGSPTLRYWRFDRLRATRTTPGEIAGDCRVLIYLPDGSFFGQYSGTFTLTK